jgi:uncharacterized protein YndB with AHSA1/START domain
MTKSAIAKKGNDRSLSIIFRIDAPVAETFDAIATRKGIASWWTPLVSRTVAPGKEFQLGFEGLDEKIRIRMDEAKRPQTVRWTVLIHSGLPEWNGSRITFDLMRSGPRKTIARFRHHGLVPQLACYGDCRAGWYHFLDSLANVAMGRPGSPFGR